MTQQFLLHTIRYSGKLQSHLDQAQNRRKHKKISVNVDKSPEVDVTTKRVNGVSPF